MKRIGMFVDVSNLYYCVNKKFGKRKLDYRKYMQFVEDLGQIQKAIAYGAQMSNQARGFILCLKEIGFETKYKTPKTYHGEGTDIKRKADWDVGIAMDMVNMIDRFDMIVLGSGDGDMLPVVEWATRQGVDVVILACTISRDLKDHATTCIEIPESLLETPKPKGAKRPHEMVNQEIEGGRIRLNEQKYGSGDKESIPDRVACEDVPAQEHDASGVSDGVAGLPKDGDSVVPDRDTPTPEADAQDLGVVVGIQPDEAGA